MNNDLFFQKLLVVLSSLTLGCLVWLIIRTYREPTHPQAKGKIAHPTSTNYDLEQRTPAPSSRAAPTATTDASGTRKANKSFAEPAPSSSDHAASELVERERVVALIPTDSTTPRHSIDQSPDLSESSNGVGELEGFIVLLGQPPPELPIQFDATCARVQPEPVTTSHYVVGKHGELANVFVYLKNAKGASARQPSPILTAKGCLFDPYIIGVVTNQPFTVRSDDKVLYNIHGTARRNKEFNFGLHMEGQVAYRTLAEPEVLVRIKSDIHPWMFAYVGVVGHPFFAVTDSRGSFHLSDIPPGTYTLAAVHPKAGEIEEQVEINAGESKLLKLRFKL